MEKERKSAFSEAFISEVMKGRGEGPYGTLLALMELNDFEKNGMEYIEDLVTKDDYEQLSVERFYEKYCDNDIEGFLIYLSKASEDQVANFKRLIDLMTQNALIECELNNDLHDREFIYEVNISSEIVDEKAKSGRKGLRSINLIVNLNLNRFINDYICSRISIDFTSFELVSIGVASISEYTH